VASRRAAALSLGRFAVRSRSGQGAYLHVKQEDPAYPSKCNVDIPGV